MAGAAARGPRWGDSRLRSEGIRLGSPVKIRVVIIAGDRMKTHARGDRVCRIVLCSSEHGCDRVVVDCNGSKIRVVIIAVDRMKTHARGDRVCRSVLCSSEHGCDRG